MNECMNEFRCSGMVIVVSVLSDVDTKAKERRRYNASHLLDQLLSSYDRRLRPGFQGYSYNLINIHI